ncbi:unnamed protein product [Mytilus coruscus]|uniref:DUF7042 domain-containing protein n=1 Tax=Mytilus coruscus TaxID=42192 RepID=A0A6J8AXV3_MYTCO|nr:unnamed protein product [Mytilus coruscus]
MKNCLSHTILYVVVFSTTVNGCTFDSDLIGTWNSNAFGTITITSNTLTLGEHAFQINGQSSTDWTCFNDATSPYIILQSELFTYFSTSSYAYICMNVQAENSNSYYFYMHSPTNNQFSNERIIVYAATATPGNPAAALCIDTPSTAEFISMVKIGSEENALTDCPYPLHRNFTYIFNKGSGDKCTTNSFVSACPGQQEMNFDYTKCAESIAYSSEGRIGCVATIDDGSGTLYTSLYNFDASVNGLTTFRFTCAAVQGVSSGDVQVSYAQKRCDANQTYISILTNGALLRLTPNDDDEKILNEPSLDPDFSHYWEAPKQELIPPVEKKSITKDMMSQTELQKERKKIIPPLPEPQAPTPKYLPWPWRTAKRASHKSAFQSQTDLRKFGPIPETTQECADLADYTVFKYGLKYDDTGVDGVNEKISRPPTRFMPNTDSERIMSRSRTSILSRSSSVASLHRSHSLLDLKTPTPRRIQLSRASSLKSLFTERTQTHVLMAIKEKKVNYKKEIPSIVKKNDTSVRPVPHYMFPIRSNSLTKFEKEQFQNPLAKPLRRSYTLLRPMPNRNSKDKNIEVRKKPKKKKTNKKKKSPYTVIPTPVRQITLIPLTRKNVTDNKVRPLKAKPKHRPPKTTETNFVVESPSTKSPKTTESNFTQSPDTIISTVNTETLNDNTEYQTISDATQHANNTVERIKADNSEFQDSGISADESSLGKQQSEYEQNTRTENGQTPAHDSNQNMRVNEQLKFPSINLPLKQDSPVHEKDGQHKEEVLKLPHLQTKQNTSTRPWR